MANFINQATLSYNGTVASSNITTGSITETVTAAKNAVTDTDTYTLNDDIVYAVSLVNNGSNPVTGITVTDDLGSYTPPEGTSPVVPLTYIDDSVTLYVNGVLQSQPTVTAGPPLEISGIDIPAGGNAVLIYRARANEYAPLDTGGSIENTAVISGAGCNDITVSETVTPEAAANLAINKTLSPTEVEDNGQVTYTFVIQNTGNTAVEEGDSAVFRDVFNPPLSNLSVTFNGQPWAETTNYTYNQSTGEFESAADQITVPAAFITQNQSTGVVTVQPRTSTLVITGNLTCPNAVQAPIPK